MLDRIKQGRATPPVHLPCRIEEIPEAYNIFRQKLSSAAAAIIGNSASASAEFVDIFQASTAASAGAIPRPKKTKQSKDFLPVEESSLHIPLAKISVDEISVHSMDTVTATSIAQTKGKRQLKVSKL